MHIEYTSEEVRTLIAEHEALDFTTLGGATADDLAEATDVLEGVEELIAKLDPELRYGTVNPYSIPVGAEGNLAWIPVANNCTRSAGLTVATDGALDFAVRPESGQNISYYFAARRAVAHALVGSQEDEVETARHEDPLGEDPLVELLKESGWAVAAGRTIADVDDEVLARAYRLSEEGIAHLFATEAGDGIVLAMAGSTQGDRRRAAQKLPKLPARSYSTRSYSVLLDYTVPGDHYSEQEGFGQTIKEAPKPKEHLLVAAAERFKASRFVRPSADNLLDTRAIRQRVRKNALVRAAIREALAVDAADAGEVVRRVVVLYLTARYFFTKIAHRALAAELPWDSKAERRRSANTSRRIRSEIVTARKARAGEPLVVKAAGELDAERYERSGGESATEHAKLRSSIEGHQKSGRASYDTARAVYLQRCPELEHKLLHLLRRDGVKAEGKFLSRHSNLAAEATNPEGALRAALRTLGESGKVRRVRSHKTGEVFLTATEPLDETGYRRSLNGLIRDERYGIVNPWTEASPVEADGETGEWEKGLENLDQHEAAILAPKRFRDTEASEQQLIAAEEVAEYSAFEEVEAVVEGFAEDIA